MIIGLDENPKDVIKVCMFEMNETCILKIGNEIGQGVYPSPQNRYRRVLNFQADNKVVSLCAKFISPGPYRIILDVPDMEEIESFTLRETVLILNGEKSLSFNHQHLYNQPKIFAAIPGNCMEQLIDELLERLLKNKRGTLLAIINGTYTNLTSLEIELKKCLLNGLAALSKGDEKTFVESIKGRGYGSSPSGDDFLCGYLIALSWLIEAWRTNLHTQRDLIYETALGANPLINTFLYQAYRFKLDKPWADFLNSLAVNRVNRIMDDYKELAGMGNTSGEDMLSGFWIGFLWNRKDVNGLQILEQYGLKKD